ncbi:hypothetical protein LXL04_015642 [Taraxacum kok-saghyz]
MTENDSSDDDHDDQIQEDQIQYSYAQEIVEIIEQVDEEGIEEWIEGGHVNYEVVDHEEYERLQEQAEDIDARNWELGMHTRGTNRNHLRITGPPEQRDGPIPNPNNPNGGVNIAAEVSRSLQESLPAIIAQIQLAMNQSSVHGTPEENHERPEHDNGRTLGCDYKAFTISSPSEFNGKGGPIAAMNWLDDMESCFQTCQCAFNQRVRYASTKLKLNALHWWTTIKTSRGVAEATSMPWGEFKGLVNSRFCPDTRLNMMEEEFMKLEQGNKSVEEYAETFLEKSRFATDMVATEASKVKRFLIVLKKDLRSYVPNNYQSNVKMKFEGKNSGRTFKKSRKEGMITFDKPTCSKCNKKHTGECMMGKNVCYKCGQPGHIMNNCPGKRACYNCGSTEHLANNCPKPKNAQPIKAIASTSRNGPEAGKAKGRLYQLSAEEAKEIPDVVTCIFLINEKTARVLFDVGS